MKTDKPKEPNQGEGSRKAARRDNRRVREDVAGGDVGKAAHAAEDFVEREPGKAKRAERTAKRGSRRSHGTRVTVDELVAKSRTVIDRVRPLVKRTIDRVRSRLARSK